MTDFRIISSEEAFLNSTNQFVILFHLAQVSYPQFEIELEYRPYEFDSQTKVFVVERSTMLAKNLIEAGERKHVIGIDYSKFRCITDAISDNTVTDVNYHISIKYLGEWNLNYLNPDFVFQTFALSNDECRQLNVSFMANILPKPNTGELYYRKLSDGRVKFYALDHWFQQIIVTLNNIYVENEKDSFFNHMSAANIVHKVDALDLIEYDYLRSPSDLNG